jgi:hypothetical protein
MTQININLLENCVFNYELLYDNNLFRITPYLYNESQNERYYYTPNNYSIFRPFVQNFGLFVNVKIENKKYFIKPDLLINNHAMYRDNNIYFDNYKVDCYPGSKLFKMCKFALEHNQRATVRINNFVIII